MNSRSTFSCRNFSMAAVLSACLASVAYSQSSGDSPFPASEFVTGISFSDSITRQASGSDNWPVTWGDDDKIYTAFGDGWGFDPRLSGKACLGTARVSGDPENYSGENLSTINAVNGSCHKPTGILMVDGVLYLWTRRDDGRLWSSSDRGQAWTNTGVTMEQPDGNFHALHFLQFGKNYVGSRDGFVYVYATGAPDVDGEIYLFRTPSSQIGDKSSYEYFSGMDSDGNPSWVSDIDAKAAIISDPGRARDVRAVYNAGLGRYLLTYSWYDGSSNGDIAILDSAEPWGPWTTVFYSTNWEGEFTFEYAFPQKWISADGQSLSMVYSGIDINDAFVVRQATLEAGIGRPLPPEDLQAN